MKKCIFYLPYKLDKNAASARMLRPRKMIQAFQDIGYDVFVISGVSCERRKLIRTVKHTIRNGEKYDFMYPIAVSCGKSTGESPSNRAAVSIPTSIPEAADSTYPSTPVICPAKLMRGSLRRR